MFAPDEFARRADKYLRHLNHRREGTPWYGKDGRVWRTSRPSALKVHERHESFTAEREAYLRLRDCHIRQIGQFSIPELIAFDDALLVIEMTIVFPPFIVDFASALLDFPPDWPQDEGHTLADFIRDRFDDQAEEVIAAYYELASRAGIYLSDFHRHNIKFAAP